MSVTINVLFLKDISGSHEERNTESGTTMNFDDVSQFLLSRNPKNKNKQRNWPKTMLEGVEGNVNCVKQNKSGMNGIITKLPFIVNTI